MSNFQSESQFVTDIYGAILHPSTWTGVLEEIAERGGAKAANICLVDHVAEELNSQFMCPETARFYHTYMSSPHMESELKAVARLPQVHTNTHFIETGDFVKKTNEVFPDDPLNLTESEQWMYDSWSVRHRYIGRLNIQPSYLDMHTIMFGDCKESRRLDGINSVSQFAPHLAKAIEISRPFLLLKSRFQATLEVLDRFKLGVFIMSSDGNLILKNSAADQILDMGDALRVDRHGMLKSDLVAENTRVEELIKSLLLQQSNGKIQRSTELVLKRRSLATPYFGEITPLSEPTIIGDITGLMIILIDPDNRKIINSSGMGKIFGLSKAENSVCQLLIEGYSTVEIAETRNVSPITVKNQIKSVLAKTGNQNRTDLIRQALNINIPVEPSAA